MPTETPNEKIQHLALSLGELLESARDKGARILVFPRRRGRIVKILLAGKSKAEPSETMIFRSDGEHDSIAPLIAKAMEYRTDRSNGPRLRFRNLLAARDELAATPA